MKKKKQDASSEKKKTPLVSKIEKKTSTPSTKAKTPEKLRNSHSAVKANTINSTTPLSSSSPAKVKKTPELSKSTSLIAVNQTSSGSKTNNLISEQIRFSQVVEAPPKTNIKKLNKLGESFFIHGGRLERLINLFNYTLRNYHVLQKHGFLVFDAEKSSFFNNPVIKRSDFSHPVIDYSKIPLLSKHTFFEQVKNGVVVCDLIAIVDPNFLVIHLNRKPTSEGQVASNVEIALLALCRRGIGPRALPTAQEVFYQSKSKTIKLFHHLFSVYYLNPLQKSYSDMKKWYRSILKNYGLQKYVFAARNMKWEQIKSFEDEISEKKHSEIPFDLIKSSFWNEWENGVALLCLFHAMTGLNARPQLFSKKSNFKLVFPSDSGTTKSRQSEFEPNIDFIFNFMILSGCPTIISKDDWFKYPDPSFLVLQLFFIFIFFKEKACFVPNPPEPSDRLFYTFAQDNVNYNDKKNTSPNSKSVNSSFNSSYSGSPNAKSPSPLKQRNIKPMVIDPEAAAERSRSAGYSRKPATPIQSSKSPSNSNSIQQNKPARSNSSSYKRNFNKNAERTLSPTRNAISPTMFEITVEKTPSNQANQLKLDREIAASPISTSQKSQKSPNPMDENLAVTSNSEKLKTQNVEKNNKNSNNSSKLSQTTSFENMKRKFQKELTHKTTEKQRSLKQKRDVISKSLRALYESEFSPKKKENDNVIATLQPHQFQQLIQQLQLQPQKTPKEEKIQQAVKPTPNTNEKPKEKPKIREYYSKNDSNELENTQTSQNNAPRTPNPPQKDVSISNAAQKDVSISNAAQKDVSISNAAQNDVSFSNTSIETPANTSITTNNSTPLSPRQQRILKLLKDVREHATHSKQIISNATTTAKSPSRTPNGSPYVTPMKVIEKKIAKDADGSYEFIFDKSGYNYFTRIINNELRDFGTSENEKQSEEKQKPETTKLSPERIRQFFEIQEKKTQLQQKLNEKQEKKQEKSSFQVSELHQPSKPLNASSKKLQTSEQKPIRELLRRQVQQKLQIHQLLKNSSTPNPNSNIPNSPIHQVRVNKLPNNNVAEVIFEEKEPQNPNTTNSSSGDDMDPKILNESFSNSKKIESFSSKKKGNRVRAISLPANWFQPNSASPSGTQMKENGDMIHFQPVMAGDFISPRDNDLISPSNDVENTNFALISPKDDKEEQEEEEVLEIEDEGEGENYLLKDSQQLMEDNENEDENDNYEDDNMEDNLFSASSLLLENRNGKEEDPLNENEGENEMKYYLGEESNIMASLKNVNQ